ncbi:hypothetical protein BRD18_07505, partial [Halobacteriales archaeon SW_7_71_33]
MDEVAACRHAARDAVRDIEPEQLRGVMDDLLVEASMTPGVVTVRAARAASAADGDSGAAVTVERYDDSPGVSARDGRREEGREALPDHVAERAAGVQLIYEGLRLIRRLAAEDPWTVTEETNPTDENTAVLAADVLVSRGFYLLARTPAADKAVETVRNFGRDQTIAREADSRNRDHDRNLEADVLRLALIAGTAATPGVAPTSGALAAAANLGRSSDRPLPPARTALAGVGVR